MQKKSLIITSLKKNRDQIPRERGNQETIIYIKSKQKLRNFYDQIGRKLRNWLAKNEEFLIKKSSAI